VRSHGTPHFLDLALYVVTVRVHVVFHRVKKNLRLSNVGISARTDAASGMFEKPSLAQQ